MKGITKSPYFRRFKLFGWNGYLTREELKRRDRNRNRLRTRSKVARLEKAGYSCELCGRHININCTLYHLLPAGMPDRNNIDNIRVICPECHEHVQHVGAYRPMIAFDDAPGAMATVKEGGAL